MKYINFSFFNLARIKTTLSIFLLSLVMILSFQNCSGGFQPVLDTSLNSSLTGPTEGGGPILAPTDKYKIQGLGSSVNLSGAEVTLFEIKPEVSKISVVVEGNSNLNKDFSVTSSGQSLSFVIDPKNLASTFNVKILVYNKTGSVLVENNFKINKINRLFTEGECSNLVLQSGGGNTCLIYKNLVHVKNNVLSQSEQGYGANISHLQKFSPKIEIPSSGYLSNPSFNVYRGSVNSSDRNQFSSSDLIVNYQNDKSDKKLSQLMAYYWLNKQLDVMKRDAGEYSAENKKINVTSSTESVPNNAYFSSSSSGSSDVVMGVLKTKDGLITGEVAHQAEVFAHEMGHANFYYSIGSDLITGASCSSSSSGSVTVNKVDYPIYKCNYTNTNKEYYYRYNINGKWNPIGPFCSSAMGCITGINEGQADMHQALLFPEDPRIGQAFMNTMSGFEIRNSLASKASITEYFNVGSPGGEIHNMGGAYFAILWKIYSNPAMLRNDFAKLFSAHLKRFSADDDFLDGRNHLLDIVKTPSFGFDQKYISIINDSFAAFGVK